ncbi:hypothetical protein AVEN_163916-1 [Araneus ventricosus]|uniref:Uncharacterized protein n=1 Tax=Araneus ventricosus TaxID=182803 RepID=A0A4Y2KCD2_ARAVE|nr:hypothetical protein AVEN_163916-1 [Araneus ventricosus]
MIDDDDASFAKAVSEKNFEDIEKLFPLVSKGVKRQYITGDDFNPLHYASSPEIVRFFISTGVDVNVKNLETDETPLLTVIKLNKSPDVIRELLKYGASIEARNKHTMNTPLNQATQIRECPPETIQALLEYGAAVNTANKYCDTPLHNACLRYRGDLRIVELLLKSGSPVNFRNLCGDSPLNVALQNPLCTAELVRILLKFNAKVNLKTFQDAVQILHDDYLNIISELIEHTSITIGVHWSSILHHLLRNFRNEQKTTDCGKLIIKHSFLQCDDPHTPIVRCLEGRSIYDFPFLHSLRVTGIVPESVHKHKSDLASINGNLKSFADDCFSEIERMKTDMLENNTSIYQFIVSKTCKVCLDSKVLKILKENTYPVYSDIIVNKIKRAALLDKLVQQQVYCVVQHGDVAQRIVLDPFSVYNIAKYLNIDEIRNFVDAFCNPSKNEYCFWDNIAEIEAHLSKKSRIRRSATKKKLASPTGHSSSKVQKKTSPRI